MLLRNLNQKAIWQGTPFPSGFKPSFFHSTAPSQAKWKNKWGFDANGNTDSAKKYGKYEKRLLRAEAKRVLRQFQSMKMSPKSSIQSGMSNWTSWRKQNQQAQSNESSWENISNRVNLKGKTRQKARTNHSAQAAERVQKSKRKHKVPRFSWDADDADERIFEVFLGGRWFYWSFKDWDELKWKKAQQFSWTGRTYSARDVSDDEASIGSASDRTALGLAPNGPLKLEDVKQAFRQCALKWHPDRNPGPSKVIAEENFKRCGTAYKALCDALSAS